MSKLTDTQHWYIKALLNSQELCETVYEGLDYAKMIRLQQVYLTANACICMLEKSAITDFSEKTILDPCCGSGQLLIAALCAGASVDKIFGNDIDIDAVILCRKRINMAIDMLNEMCAYGINNRKYIEDWQIHQGNALIPDCLNNFGPEYEETVLKKYEI